MSAQAPNLATWRRLVGLVRQRTGGCADAEDCVQAAYVKLVEHSRHNSVSNPEGFILNAATNLAISDLRKEARHRRAHADVAVASILEPEMRSTHEVIDARERLKIVEEAISELPPRARQIFVLHRVDGLSYSEIARLEGISVSAVEKNMARALSHLATRLVGFGRSRGRSAK